MRAGIAALLGLVALGHAVINVPSELLAIGQPEQTLTVSFPVGSSCSSENEAKVQPGQTLQDSETKQAPIPDISQLRGDTFIVMMVDPDINTTNPTYVGLHTLIANLTTTAAAAATTDANSSALTSTSVTIASYIAPVPPGGEAAHNYTFFAFRQPANFSIASRFASYMATTAESPLNRINFPLEQFIAEAGLGEPLAANWFREAASSANATASTTATVCSASSTSSTPTTTTTTTSSSAGVGIPQRVGLARAVPVGMVLGVLFAV